MRFGIFKKILTNNLQRRVMHKRLFKRWKRSVLLEIFSTTQKSIESQISMFFRVHEQILWSDNIRYIIFFINR